MKKTEKEFDCVEMKREGARHIHEELKGKTHEERMAYWARKNEEFRRRYPDMRTLDQEGTTRR
ncbi:MAG: hypothetical protein ACLFTT_09235 [Candidatus Hydrogenedentota bacterium]